MPNPSTPAPAPLRLALIGFGEVGKIFAEALVQQSDVAALAVVRRGVWAQPGNCS